MTTPFAPHPTAPPARFTRRALLRTGAGAATILAFGPAIGPAFAATGDAASATRPWLLASASEFRPAAPGAPTAAEIAEVGLAQTRRAATAEVVARWGDGPAVLPWTRQALGLIRLHRPSPARAARALALVHAAMDDAVTASLDAQAAHRRPAPVAAGSGGNEPNGAAFGFPSAQAAVAGAASTALAHLFPGSGQGLRDLSTEAADSRIWAGAAYRSDVEAGLALGRAIGERAVARALADGADAEWGGNRPNADGLWRPTAPAFVETPLDPLAGTWRPWVIGAGHRARPKPPPAWGSPAWQRELDAVRAAVAARTPAQEAAIRFWAGGRGTVTPAGLWIERAVDLIARDGLDLPRAARVLALTGVALADAVVCCWDAKYAYWSARPITADPTLDTLIPTPPFPSYPSGHATLSAAAAAVLGHHFPADAPALAAAAEEAKNTRLWSGIHFPIDNETGAVLGQIVGGMVVDLARTQADSRTAR